MKPFMKAAFVLAMGTSIHAQPASAFTDEQYITTESIFSGGDRNGFFERFSN